jgi:arylsulfatase A-like enzyme
MPFVDSLAASGAYFPWAYATTSWSLPSHGTIVTGEYPGRLNTTITEPLDPSFPTLGEAFAERGFYTAGFTGNLHFTSWESGINQGFREWHDYRRSLRQVLRSSLIGEIQMFIEISDATSWADVVTALRRHQIMVYPKPVQDTPVATEMTDRYLAWDARRPSRPYLAFVNFIDAHEPYAPPGKYRTRFAPQPTQRDLYDAELAYVDDELRRLFTELRRRGGLQHTFIVLTADHGEHFGGHGLREHGNSLYNSALHVPLIVVGPGIPPHRVEHAVSTRDLPRTILELAGVRNDFPGVSLAGYLTDSSFRSSPVLAELGSDTAAEHSYLDDEFHLIQGPKSEELYRYRIDPRERNDLAHADSMQSVLVRLRLEMAHAFATQASPSPSAPGSGR